MNESYKWVEKAIVFRPELRNWQSLVRDGLLEAGVDPYNGFSLEHLVGTKIGGSTCDSSGRRHSAADLQALLNDAAVPLDQSAAWNTLLQATLEKKVRSQQEYIQALTDEGGWKHFGKPFLVQCT